VIRQVVEIVLLVTGIAAVALSCVGLLVAREAFLRLHYLGPASSLGAPLVIAALVVHEGVSALALKLVLIGVLLVGSGAVTVAAFGRSTAQRAGLVETDSPA
jgi:multicomponent Na+:H+ antiporter subunit G